FVIINGNKINTDDTSLNLMQYLFTHPYSCVKNILEHFQEHSPEKINKLLFQLSVENVIELVM
ncbi:cupin domain-containing protein, partial [Acinetobacter baumannii]|nr:cupin domain-containing protein [Acinetobacter baumannii]